MTAKSRIQKLETMLGQRAALPTALDPELWEKRERTLEGLGREFMAKVHGQQFAEESYGSPVEFVYSVRDDIPNEWLRQFNNLVNAIGGPPLGDVFPSLARQIGDSK